MLCAIRLSLWLPVSLHCEQGSAVFESPPVCSVKPLQAVKIQLRQGPRHLNLLPASPQTFIPRMHTPQFTVCVENRSSSLYLRHMRESLCPQGAELIISVKSTAIKMYVHAKKKGSGC